MTRLLLVALDGATLDLVGPWMRDGRLPLLARLWQEGRGGTLVSTVPWATPTAFASLATGTNPGKHGVFDFGTLVGDDYSAFVPTNGGDVHGRTLWRLLSDAGLKTAVVNMPMTYPAEPINGWLVAGIPYPRGSARLCHPPGLLDRLHGHGWDLSRNASDDLGGDYAAYFAGLLELTRARGEATAWLIDRHNPDVVAVHFLETDQVQHRFWQFMPGEARYEPGGLHTDAILRLFQASEAALQQILNAAGDDVTLCLMSDHGFGPTRRQVWLNNWLIANGFMTLKPAADIRAKQTIYRLGLSPAAVREAAPERLKLAILRFFEQQKGRALAGELEGANALVARKGFLDRLTERLALDFYDVDWSRTRAFSTGTTSVGYVWLNLRGRDPQGIVAPGADYQQTRAAVRDALLRWEPVGEVLTREEVWHGPRVPSAPDLIVRWADPATDARYFQTRFSSHHLFKDVPNDYAGHRPEGLYLWHGRYVRPGPAPTADLVDLTPTILWLLDQPVPDNMDGRVQQALFTLDRPVQSVPAPRDLAQPDTLSAEEEAAIMESLRGLGYIE